MSDDQQQQRRWDTFIAWARRFYEEWPDFDTEEREYKLAIGQRLRASREALRAGSPSWLDLLSAVVADKQNNLLNWRVKPTIVTWCREQPEQAQDALVRFWEDLATPEPERIDALRELVPRTAVGGMYTEFGSFLLMALDATSHPMYRNDAYVLAYRLTGYPKRPGRGVSGLVYQHAVQFLDRLLGEAAQRQLPLRDRLDAQSVLWCMTWYKETDEPVRTWSAQERTDFFAFRASGEQDQPEQELDTDDPMDPIEPMDPTGPSEPATTAWMFQFNPDHYHLDHHIQEHGPYDWWEAKQHRQDMHIGQRVYFMQSGGADRAAIVAVGRIVSEVYPAPEDADHPYRVDVWYEARVEPPIERQRMRQDPALVNYRPYAVGVFSTNFRLPLAVAERTAELVESRLRSFAVNEQTDEWAEGEEGDEFDLASSVVDARTRTVTAVVRRQGQLEFRQRLLAAYGRQCAITGCDAVDALEAAHIVPYRGPHTNHTSNGLLLRADIHNLFDLGLLAVDCATMTLVLAPALAATMYAELVGHPLRLPSELHLRPSREALEAHRQRAGL